MDARISSLVGSPLAMSRSPAPRPETSFRDHLARGLSVASEVAQATGTVVPGAGLVGVALSGLSRVIGGTGEPAGGSGVLEETRAFNMQYLLLQEEMQRESRAYTALSNIMRVRHEAAKNALANIR